MTLTVNDTQHNSIERRYDEYRVFFNVTPSAVVTFNASFTHPIPDANFTMS
jgi:hypothetical protein